MTYSDDVNMAIEPGEIIGIIGPSGSGKSTLVELLLGLRSVRAGSLTIDDVDMEDIDRRSWSALAAFVAQDALLLSGSIERNIQFFRPEITVEQVDAAARAARIADDIAGMPNGLRTEVGERGSRLSGGQRQRVAIARALAAEPQLLVLDEPTAALDVRSEALIRQSIADLKGTTTVVIIAHRMSTLDICDRILILEAGRRSHSTRPARSNARSRIPRTARPVGGHRPMSHPATHGATASHPPYRYEAYNLHIASDVELPEVPCGTIDVEPDVCIRLGEVATRLENPTGEGARYQAAPNRLLLTIDDVGRFLVRDGREIVVDLDPEATLDDARVFVLGSCLGALLHQRGSSS